MLSKKHELKEQFEKEIKPLIIYTLSNFKGVKFFIEIEIEDEPTLKKGLDFFIRAYPNDLRNFIDVARQVFEILPSYLNQVKEFVNDKNVLSSEDIKEQLAKVMSITKIIDRADKYVNSWIADSEAYYAVRLGSSIDLMFGRFNFIDPKRVPVSYPFNIERLSIIPKFLQKFWKKHFDFYYFGEDIDLDTEIAGICESEKRFNILKNA